MPIADNQNSLKAGARGPALLEDFILREKITHFDHERIPERIVHARGSGAHGFFECYEPLTQYTKAAPFKEAGKVTPVFVRFSTVAGERGSKDTARDVRGFAVKFYTDEGNWDLVGNNMPVFFIQDAMKFPDLVHAVKPEPHHQMPQAASAHDTFWDFVSLMPESTHMLMWLMSDRAIPRSYRMMQGFGVHTFRLVNEAGESVFVKFHWQPMLGTHSLVWDEAVKISGADPDFHRRDLWEAIEAGEYPEWELGLQIFTEEQAEQFSFDVLDATKLVPEELVPVQIVGRMVLNRNPDNFFAETEQVAFCTAHVVPGTRFHATIRCWPAASSPTSTRRSAGWAARTSTSCRSTRRSPRCTTTSATACTARRSIAAASPTSPTRSAAAARSRPARPRASPASRGASTPRRAPTRCASSPEKFADHYTQARLFFESQSEVEKAHIGNAFRFELSKVTVPAIRERVVASLLNAAPDLAARLAQDLGMDLPAPMPKALENPASPEVDSSPALSLLATARRRWHPDAQDRGAGCPRRRRRIAGQAGDGAGGGGRRARAWWQPASAPMWAWAARSSRPTRPWRTRRASCSTPWCCRTARMRSRALDADAHTLEFVRAQYWHCKTILAFGASQALLAEAQIPMTMPDGSADPGLILADAGAADEAIADFIGAMGKPRHFGRENDPPLA